MGVGLGAEVGMDEEMGPLTMGPQSKLLQIRPRRDAQHKPARGIRHDREVLLCAGTVTGKERLELLQRRLHRDEAVGARTPAEARHGLLDGIRVAHRARVEQAPQRRGRDVAQQRLVGRREHGQMRVVALKGREQRVRDGRVGGGGEGGGRVEVFDGGLTDGNMVSWEGRGVVGFMREGGTCPAVFVRPW
nr:hypothetical protein CFP56_52282 [Quercus suber]